MNHAYFHRFIHTGTQKHLLYSAKGRFSTCERYEALYITYEVCVSIQERTEERYKLNPEKWQDYLLVHIPPQTRMRDLIKPMHKNEIMEILFVCICESLLTLPMSTWPNYCDKAFTNFTQVRHPSNGTGYCFTCPNNNKRHWKLQTITNGIEMEKQLQIAKYMRKKQMETEKEFSLY